MSIHCPQQRLSILDIRQRREAGSLVVLSAYSAPMARLLEPYAGGFAGHGALRHAAYPGRRPGHLPRFAEQYVRVDELIRAAAERFASDVRERPFPQARHCSGMAKG